VSSSDGESLGARVRRLRLAQGRSQTALSCIGISASYLSLIEAGKRRPTPATLAVIASGLDTTVQYLTSGLPDADRAEIQIRLGTAKLLLEDGDAHGAAAVYRGLLDAEDPDVAHAARWGLAVALEAEGDLAEAITSYERFLALACAEPTREPYLAAATALSRCYREAGDLGRAVDVGEAALARSSGYGLEHTDGHVAVLLTVAMAYVERGDLTRSQQLLGQVQQNLEALGSPRSRGGAYWNAAVLAGELGRTADAVTLIERALALFGEGDDERNLSRLRNAYATLIMRHDPGRAGEAVGLLETARERLGRLGSAVDVAYCETELCRALSLMGRYDQAVLAAESALSRLGEGTRLEAARARAALAHALAGAGELPLACEQYAGAAGALQDMGARRQAALVWLELAQLEERAGTDGRALRAATSALAAAGLSAPFPAPGSQDDHGNRAGDERVPADGGRPRPAPLAAPTTAPAGPPPALGSPPDGPRHGEAERERADPAEPRATADADNGRVPVGRHLASP